MYTVFTFQIIFLKIFFYTHKSWTGWAWRPSESTNWNRKTYRQKRAHGYRIMWSVIYQMSTQSVQCFNAKVHPIQCWVLIIHCECVYSTLLNFTFLNFKLAWHKAIVFKFSVDSHLFIVCIWDPVHKYIHLYTYT